MRFLEVFRRRILLMHVGGIPVWADYRWFFVLIVMSAITASSLATIMETGAVSYLLGLLTTIVFFGSVLIHELAHALAARVEGVQVIEIALHPFGGMARLRHEPKTPRAEFRIAVAGPAASFLLALLFVVMMAASNAADAPVFGFIFFALASFNFLIGIFNLFPGYPLDGGRVLRAYLWRSGRDFNEATVLTGRAGQVIGGVLIAFGLLIAISRADFFTGFWMILVGLFLYDAAKSIIKEVRSIDCATVADLMHLPSAVEPDANILYFVDHILPVHRRIVFPVAKDRRLYGMLLLKDMKAIPRERWHATLIKDVMQAIKPEHFVDISATVLEAREQMRANGIDALGVLDKDGLLVGFLGSGSIKKAK